jgi:hypothetical protein
MVSLPAYHMLVDRASPSVAHSYNTCAQSLLECTFSSLHVHTYFRLFGPGFGGVCAAVCLLPVSLFAAVSFRYFVPLQVPLVSAYLMPTAQEEGGEGPPP